MQSGTYEVSSLLGEGEGGSGVVGVGVGRVVVGWVTSWLGGMVGSVVRMYAATMSLAGAATSIIFVATNTCFTCLSR